MGAYSASKAAMVSLVKTVALENKDPGSGQRDSARDDGHSGEPRGDAQGGYLAVGANRIVASLIVWLAGDGGKDVTGAAIPVYGRGL